MYENNLVRQYRAELFDENSNIVITGNHPKDVHEKVVRVLNSTPHFEQKNVYLQLIWNRKGGSIVGWVNELDVPSVMAIRPAAENTAQAQEQAAA